MLALLALAQLAAAAPPADSNYATPALRDFIARAAVANRAAPPTLGGYHARVESEFSFVVHDSLGREESTQVEQLEAQATWQRGAHYDFHIVGYRTQAAGAPVSMLSIIGGWTVPTLYGDRLSLGAIPVRELRDRDDSTVAVHPFAGDRDRYYRFSGGDTVTVLHTAGRAIPIVRVRVQPNGRAPERSVVFDGEIYLDADRAQIVRMHGEFVIVGAPHRGRPLWARLAGATGVAFVEFVNAEVDGRYWLPAFQRTELEANIPLLGENRVVLRLLSRFDDYRVTPADADSAAAALLSPDSLPRAVSWSPADSLSRFDGWQAPMGAATGAANASDFDDVAPDIWRPTGPPRVDFIPTRPENVLRYDRVEGVYTGWSARVRFRDAVPGLTAQAFGGWAWTERTVRGGAKLTLRRGMWLAGARAERQLVSTADFAGPQDLGSGDLGALFASVDDNDYVDRTIAAASATRILGRVDRALITVQAGAGRDASEIARLTRGGLATGGTMFRPNRYALTGSYGFASADLEWHPNVSDAFVEPGVGARLHAEAAAGGLAWNRVELDLAARQYWGPFTATARADGGMVAGRVIPPQQLFEVGGSQTLSAYSYKEFAGDRAALFGGFISYVLPIWRTPHRLWRAIMIPGLAPGFAVGADGGWTEISSASARRAVDALGTGWSATPVSRATDGVRASVGAGITFFSASVHLGIARPVDHAAPWRLVAGFGRSF